MRVIGENFIRKSSGLYVPPVIGLAALGRFQPCTDCCPPIECEFCLTGFMPREYSVVIAGLSDDGPRPCSQFNATWIAVHVGSPCARRVDLGTFIVCDLHEHLHWLIVQARETPESSPTEYEIIAGILSLHGNPVAFRKSYGTTKPDCEALVDEDIPWIGGFQCLYNPPPLYQPEWICGEGGTCVITAL